VKIILLMILFLSPLLMGCETVHRGAQEVGKPIGAATKAVGGITEGAAQSYGDQETDNPFDR